MKNRTPISAFTPSCYFGLFRSKRAACFATILILSFAAVSIITALTFAHGREKIVRRESQTSQSAPTQIARGFASSRNGSRRVKGSPEVNQDQDQDRRGADRVEKGRGNVSPKEWRLRKARPFTGDLRQLPRTRPLKAERPEREAPELNPQIFVPAGGVTEQSGKAPSLAVAPLVDANAPAPPPTANFEGLDFDNWGNGHPADANGDVGPNHYIQAINSSVGIFNKSNGNLVAGFTFNTFMSQGHFGNLCDTSNLG